MKKRVRYPKIPVQPYAPYKPTPPAKEIEDKKTLGVLTSQEDGEFGIDWFKDYIIEKFPNEDPSNVKFSMEINKDYGYYDELSTSLTFTFYTVKLIPDPKYKKNFAHYEKNLEKYEKDYAKYKSDLKQYKIDKKKYKEELEMWQVEHAKSIISNYEKKKNLSE